MRRVARDDQAPARAGPGKIQEHCRALPGAPRMARRRDAMSTRDLRALGRHVAVWQDEHLASPTDEKLRAALAARAGARPAHAPRRLGLGAGLAVAWCVAAAAGAAVVGRARLE